MPALAPFRLLCRRRTESCAPDSILMSSIAINNLIVARQVLEKGPARDDQQEPVSVRGAELTFSHARGEIASDLCWRGRLLLEGIYLTLIDDRKTLHRVALLSRRRIVDRPDMSVTELVGQANGLCFTVNLHAYPHAG